jgi:hypothetical protein
MMLQWGKTNSTLQGCFCGIMADTDLSPRL